MAHIPTHIQGRNRNATNTTTTTTVEINSVTATTILAANPNRLWARVSLSFGTTSIEAMVREYPAADDNIKQGEIIVRHTSSNDSLFKPVYTTLGDNVYTGELSAISMAGTFNLHITEG